jgi:hypothetical protein
MSLFTKKAENSVATNTVTLPSFTPNANRLLLVLTWTYDTNVTSVTGHGTWQQIAVQHAGSIASPVILSIWGCITSSSPSAGSVVVTHSAANDIYAAVFECDAAYGGVDIATAIPKVATNYDTTQNASADLVSFVNQDSATALAVIANMVTTTATPQGSLSADLVLDDIFLYSTADQIAKPTISQSPFGHIWGAIAMEIAKASSGPGPQPDVVVSQNPAANAMVNIGSAVDVVMGPAP